MDFFTLFVVEGNKIVIGGGSDAVDSSAVSAETSVAQPQPSGTAPSGIMSSLPMFGYFAVIIAIMYFFMIRPQRKREKELKDMQSSIKIGDPIVTSGGMFGKVVDITEGAFVIEFGTNKGVRIPMRKSEVIGIVEPNLTNKKDDITENDKY